VTTTVQLTQSKQAPAVVVDDVVVRFGGVSVLEGVSLQIQPGEIVGVIGPNGSGKTTLLNVISRFVAPVSGGVRWGDEGARVRRATSLTRRGVGRTFQQPQLVDELAAVDNVRLALDRPWRAGGLRRARSLLERVHLSARVGESPISSLSYGQRRLVDLARALATASSLLLLDEPTAGVGPEDWELIADVVRELRDDGLATIVTDHNVGFMSGLCDRGVFLHHGKLLAENRMEQLLVDPIVIDAYVGGGHDGGVRSVSTRPAGADRPDGEARLRLDGVSAGYRGADVLHEVSVVAGPGQWIGVIGPNGAGKSTLLGCVSGLVQPRRGTVQLNGLDLRGRARRDRVRLGLAHVQEGRRIFKGLSVEDNLRAGLLDNADWDARSAEIYDLFPALAQRRRQQAASLSGGQQQMLVIGRALMSGPKVMLLDEPTLGLAPIVVEAVLQAIGRVVATGITVVMTDEDARRAVDIVDHAYVLVDGAVRLEASSEQLRERIEEIEHAYLGGL
jgi:ABC-type branched-subunit amino acid transport system ATPase component